jgi:hypothetical protein
MTTGQDGREREINHSLLPKDGTPNPGADRSNGFKRTINAPFGHVGRLVGRGLIGHITHGFSLA